MATYAEQIAAYENKRAANMKGMEDIMSKSAEKGETLDAAQQEEFDNLQADNDAIDSHLKRLRTLEKNAAETATPVAGFKSVEGTQARSGVVAVPMAEKLDKGIAFARIAKVKALSRLDGESVRTVAKELYGENSEIYGHFVKAAVPAATTTNATWAKPLVGDTTSAFADFVEFLRPQTILGRFGMNGIPSLRQVPFRVPLIGQTTGGDGYWVGEGKAKPLTKFDFERKTLEPLKVANIAVATEEVLRDSSPAAEAIIRDQLAAALRQRLDTDFINPAKTAVAGISPASITNGVTAVKSAGKTADNVRTDIQALFGAFIAANNAPTSGVWIMKATTALALSLMQNPLGQSEFPGIGMNGGTLFGLPVIVSEFVPTVTGSADPTDDGAYVMLVNAQDIYFADNGDIAVDFSREASLEMADNPTHNSDVPTGSNALVSMWQTNSVAFRAERSLNWMARRSNAVQMLSAVNWGA